LPSRRFIQRRLDGADNLGFRHTNDGEKFMRSMKARGLLLAAALAFGVATMAPAAVAQVEDHRGNSGQARAKATNDIYIVRMADRPAVAYEGGIPGYPATKPRRGAKIDPNDPKVVRYAGLLDSRHDAAIARVGARKVYGYRYAFNGFAAAMTPAQAEALKSAPGVLSVDKDQVYQMDTASTPAFLGLSQTGGLWARTGARGENVIIGMVDSGVWPEHASFSDRTGTNGGGNQDSKLDYQQMPGWHGMCTPGEAFNASNCNQKLIGARYYNAGWGGNAAIDWYFPFEFNSPRDWAGHGTHTATTAGGNANTPVTGPFAIFGAVSGIAPRARIAAYKVCWADQPTGGGCFGSDSVAAIDQAVADGVDVINFSISGTRTNFRDAVEIAFMFAADAGVFVAASAGNSGPTTSTVAHPGPWLTTVAAGTHNRDGTGSVTLGNGVTYAGASYSSALAAMPLIDSVDAGLAGADATMVELCYSAADNVVAGVPTPVLDPAKVAGKVVLCKRGATALVNKSGAVAAAGGAGAIIYNDPAGVTSILALMHAVPTVHVVAASGLAIKAYAASASPTAEIAQSTIVMTAAAPFTANFSSRGPLLAGNGDLLKPDLIAPGQDILAGVAPPNNGGRLFDLYSGTSMSSPHVAGLAALFKELHPGWSPMAIKSALMTSAGDVLDDSNTDPLVIFKQGAGHVRPNQALNPGLVFDSGFGDWIAFICGTQPGAFCAPGQAIDPSDFNVASIAVGNLTGTQTVKRRVTNVSGAPATFTATHAGMAGFTVTVSPASLVLANGQTKQFTVTLTRTTAPLNEYTGGQLTLTDGTHVVRLPMVAKPVALAAPAEVSGSYSVTFGYDGPFTATPRGLVAPAITDGNVAQDPDQTFDPASPAGTVAIPVVIPTGSTYVRLSLFDADVTPGSDLDLFVYLGPNLVGVSAAGGSNEEVSFDLGGITSGPIPLTVYVHGWGVVGGTSPFKLHAWHLGTGDAGNMTVTAPATATLNATGTIELGFIGLTPGTKYLGSVVYGGAAGMPSPTIVRVDP
jgi:subtilisin family serine protease